MSPKDRNLNTNLTFSMFECPLLRSLDFKQLSEDSTMLILAWVKCSEDCSPSLSIWYLRWATINKSESSYERSALIQLLLIPLYQLKSIY